MKTSPQFAVLRSIATLFEKDEVALPASPATMMQLLTEDESARVAGGPECEVGGGG